MPTNEERAEAAQRAIDACADEGGDAGIIDTLANLRHLCDRDGMDFAELDRMAYNHYLEEK